MNEYKYDNKLEPIYGFFTNNSPNPFLRFEDFSFNLNKLTQKTGKLFFLKGIISHYSTIEAFNKVSNYDEIISYAEKISKSEESSGKYIPTFVLLIFGDLKNFTFKYTLVDINNHIEYKVKRFLDVNKLPEKEFLIENYQNISNQNEDVLTYNSTKVFKNIQTRSQFFFLYDLYSDSSKTNLNVPIYLKSSIIEKLLKNQIDQDLSLNVVLIKDYYNFSTSVSLTIDELKINSELNIKFEYNNLKISTSDLKQMFDTKTIAENAVDLNINLMKWRMAPDINTEIIKNTKFLIIGAGTLGCHVSRNLLGWGARYIDFIDCGKISYSNPVRQSLYSFQDSSSNTHKASMASNKLKEIFPLVNSEGYSMQIPLPSRSLVNSNAENAYFKTLEQLETIISEHDVLFLLTDSRESRWYPTLIGKFLNKVVLTAAIGFDSFLVMRHGMKENNLGCYFCNDIVSPIDTSMNRTLDQQCTISRPGISGICSGFASELAISVLQGNKCNIISQNTPQSIRGNLRDYQFLSIDHTAFKLY